MKYNLVLKSVLDSVALDRNEALNIKKNVEDFVRKLKINISKAKQKPEIFVGGSYAKNTMIKKNKYDVDIFLRYDKNNTDSDLSEKTGHFLKNFEGMSVVHGSRDYFRVKINEKLYIEIVPVIKVNSPKNSKNITDLSYSHVRYINRKIKNKKILDEIKIAKAFCYANGCYGAESYIKGFSGYSLELLVYHYKGFIKMIKELSKHKQGEKIIIDIEKKYKNKNDVLMDINSSKLESPVILVDPTYEQRNALAALSNETFEKFKEVCKEFLKKPSTKYFEEEIIDLDKLKKNAEKKKQEFVIVEASTEKPEGDVAGSKLLKFYNHLYEEIKRFFEIKDRGFSYGGKDKSRYFFVALKKKEVIYGGPFVKDKENVSKFKKEHKKVYEKKGRLYSKEEVKLDLKEFIEKWAVKNKKRIVEMSIRDLRIVN